MGHPLPDFPEGLEWEKTHSLVLTVLLSGRSYQPAPDSGRPELRRVPPLAALLPWRPLERRTPAGAPPQQGEPPGPIRTLALETGSSTSVRRGSFTPSPEWTVVGSTPVSTRGAGRRGPPSPAGICHTGVIHPGRGCPRPGDDPSPTRNQNEGAPPGRGLPMGATSPSSSNRDALRRGNGGKPRSRLVQGAPTRRRGPKLHRGGGRGNPKPRPFKGPRWAPLWPGVSRGPGSPGPAQGALLPASGGGSP